MKNHKTNLALLSLTTLVTLCAILTADAAIIKRSFVNLGCMGEYDKSYFAYLDRICEECFNLYREPGLHAQCRSYCFKNEYFDGCVKALLYDNKEKIELMVNKLFGGT